MRTIGEGGCSHSADDEHKAEENELTHFKDLLNGAIDSVSKSMIRKAITSNTWRDIMQGAVDDCPLAISICSVAKQSQHSYPAVYANKAARNQISDVLTSKKLQELSFMELWSITSIRTTEAPVLRSLSTPEPLQLFSQQCVGGRRTILDITHIFDHSGVHRYVLGVQMDVPQNGMSKEHMLCLTDTALLVAHLINTGASATLTPCSPASVAIPQAQQKGDLQ